MMSRESDMRDYFKDVKVITGLASKELSTARALDKNLASKLQRFFRNLKGGARTLGFDHLSWTILTAEDLLKMFCSGEYVSYNAEIVTIYKDFFSYLNKFPNDVSLNFNEIISRLEETRKKLE